MELEKLGTLGETIEQIDTREMDGKDLTFVIDHQLLGYPLLMLCKL